MSMLQNSITSYSLKKKIQGACSKTFGKINFSYTGRYGHQYIIQSGEKIAKQWEKTMFTSLIVL